MGQVREIIFFSFKNAKTRADKSYTRRKRVRLLFTKRLQEYVSQGAKLNCVENRATAQNLVDF